MHWDGLCKSSHNILESRAVLVGMGPSAAAQISSYSFYHEDIQVNEGCCVKQATSYEWFDQRTLLDHEYLDVYDFQDFCQ